MSGSHERSCDDLPDLCELGADEAARMLSGCEIRVRENGLAFNASGAAADEVAVIEFEDLSAVELRLKRRDGGGFQPAGWYEATHWAFVPMVDLRDAAARALNRKPLVRFDPEAEIDYEAAIALEAFQLLDVTFQGIEPTD